MGRASSKTTLQAQLRSTDQGKWFAWRVKGEIHPINPMRSMPSSFFCRARGLWQTKQAAPQGWKGKVYCPLDRAAQVE